MIRINGKSLIAIDDDGICLITDKEKLKINGLDW